MRFFKYNIWYWLKEHCNINNTKVIKAELKSFNWDYNFLYELEKAKLEQILYSFEHSNVKFINQSRKEAEIKLCINLLNIVINGSTDLFEYNEQPKYDFKDCGDGLTELIKLNNPKKIMKVYVNTNNINVYVENNNQLLFFQNNPEDLYVEKARILYHRIRQRYEQGWWW